MSALLFISACGRSNTEDKDSLAVVDSISLKQDEDQLLISAMGTFKNGCTKIDHKEIHQSGKNIEIEMTTIEEGDVCIQTLMPYIDNTSLLLKDLKKGEYTISVNGVKESITL